MRTIPARRDNKRRATEQGTGMYGPRYERIVPLLTLVVAGLGVVFVLDAGAAPPALNLGPGLPLISLSWVVVALIALVAGAGAEMIVRSHPRFSPNWLTPVRLGRLFNADLLLRLWILPGLTPVAIFAFFRLWGGALATAAYLLVLLVTGAVLLLVFVEQQRVLVGGRTEKQTATTRLAVVAYVLAFAIFAAVAFNRYRTLYAGALLLPSTLLLAYDLLRARTARPWPAAAAIALVAVESYWALSYWPAPFLLVGAALLVIFYTAVGLAQSADERGLQRPALVEYGSLALVALAALAVAAMLLEARIERLLVE